MNMHAFHPSKAIDVCGFNTHFLHMQLKIKGTVWRKILTGENCDKWEYGKFWRKKIDEFHNVNAHIY